MHPSSGAASPEGPGGLPLSAGPSSLQVAAPEDGRSPGPSPVPLFPRYGPSLIFRASTPKLRFEPFPWPLRCVSWVLVWSQLAYPFSNQVFAAVDAVAALPQASGVAGPGSTTTPPRTINRTIPEVQPPPSSPAFSDNPTEDEVFRARMFAEPLMPTGQASAEENRALAQALLTFIQRPESEDFSALTQFSAQYPQSAWRASLLFNLGLLHRQAGYCTRALAAWEEVWAATKATHEPKAKALADAVLGELMELNYRLGGTERLEALFAEIQGRDIHGPATEKNSAARATFSMMRSTPDNAYRCAPMALARLRALLNPLGLFDPPLIQPRLSTKGISLADACTLAYFLG